MGNYLVIGASSGIGKSTAQQLIDEGHTVIGSFNSTTSDHLQGVDYHQFDVLNDDPTNLIPDQLDGLVYCPGSINLLPFNRIKPEAFKDDYELQVIGAIKCIQAALPALKKSDNPSIVLFSTVAVQHGFGFHAQVAASKGAIEGLTKSLAAEFAPKIRVNTVAPSLTNTPLASKLLSTDQKLEANAERHPLKSLGEAQDIASMASFLLSDKAKWISGQIIHVDGGMSSIRG